MKLTYGIDPRIGLEYLMGSYLQGDTPFLESSIASSRKVFLPSVVSRGPFPKLTVAFFQFKS